jgi:NAD-dependent deacetylase
LARSAGLVEFARDDAERVVNALELDAVPRGFRFLPGKATEVIPRLVADWR